MPVALSLLLLSRGKFFLPSFSVHCSMSGKPLHREVGSNSLVEVLSKAQDFSPIVVLCSVSGKIHVVHRKVGGSTLVCVISLPDCIKANPD